MSEGETRSAASVVDEHDLHFDPAGAENGSLYIAFARDTRPPIDLGEVVSALRAASLWSDQDPKTVPETHRAAYREQLELKSVRRFQAPPGAFAITRFDHPKFPSDGDRWAAWEAFFESRYQPVPD